MPILAPIVLLFCSNVFMTFAWYGQLKFPPEPVLDSTAADPDDRHRR